MTHRRIDNPILNSPFAEPPRHFAFDDGTTDEVVESRRRSSDDDAWATLHSTMSRPLAKPATGRIAVKAIDHHGDEILQLYEVP